MELELSEKVIKTIDRQFKRMLKNIPDLERRRKQKDNGEYVRRFRDIKRDLKHLEAIGYLFGEDEKGRLTEKVRQHYKASQDTNDFLKGKDRLDFNWFVVQAYLIIHHETRASDSKVYRRIAEYLQSKDFAMPNQTPYASDDIKHIVERNFKKAGLSGKFMTLHFARTLKDPITRPTTK
jgi:hypothetical protein